MYLVRWSLRFPTACFTPTLIISEYSKHFTDKHTFGKCPQILKRFQSFQILFGFPSTFELKLTFPLVENNETMKYSFGLLRLNRKPCHESSTTFTGNNSYRTLHSSGLSNATFFYSWIPKKMVCSFTRSVNFFQIFHYFADFFHPKLCLHVKITNIFLNFIAGCPQVVSH